jgi:putative endonuclease
MQNPIDKKKKDLGKWGEQQAKRILELEGILIIGQNIHTPYGEIDLIGMKGTELIFFEVKTRSSVSFGYPEVSVSKRKIQHMKSAAFSYLQETNKLDVPWRIDVFSIIKSQDSSCIYEWFKNAVTDE